MGTSIWFQTQHVLLPGIECHQQGRVLGLPARAGLCEIECIFEGRFDSRFESQEGLSPNKTIECPRPRSCPKCGSTNFLGRERQSKTVLDLKFMRHGIKRWIILYRFHRYKCQSCGATFSPEMGWTRSKFGSGIVAYALYQNIELRLPQESVDRSLNKLFGVDLAIGTTGRFKAKAAKTIRRNLRCAVQTAMQRPIAPRR